MTPPDDGNTHQQLGNLTAKVDMLIEASRRSEEKSDLSRSQMHQRMDHLVDRVGKVEGNLAVVQEDVKEMKPTIDDVKAWRQRGIGGLFIVGIGASALSFLVTTYFSNIIGWITKAGP